MARVTRALDPSQFDTDVRIADDLFRHVNGRWLATVEIPEDKPMTGAFVLLRDASEAAVHTICDELAAADRSALTEEQAKVADLYGDFMAAEHVEELDAQPLEDLLERVDQIDSVRVGASRFAMQPLVHDIPSTGLEGKFSMRYCVGAALCDGVVKAWTFEPQAIAREDIRAMMDRITVEIDPLVADDHEFAAIVDIILKSGRKESVRIDVASGKPGNWLTEGMLREKFLDCVMQSAHDHETATALYEGARSLPGLARIDSVVLPLMKAISQSVAYTAAK